MRAIVFASTVAVAVTTSGFAAAEEFESPERQATAFLERGLEHYEDGNYELAIVEFRAGYGLDPRPEFLFALAQAERLSGDCVAALIYYERFLDTDPGSNQAEAARVNTKRCRRALESGPELASSETLAEDADASEDDRAGDVAVAAPAPIEPTTRPRPWYRDVLTMSLVTGGAASLGAGAWSWRAARDEARDAGAADSYGAYADHMERAESFRKIAWIGAGVGAAAFTGAVVRAVTRPGARSERPTAAVHPRRNGAVIAIGGRF